MDGALGLGEFDAVELLQLLDPALHLFGLGRLGAETGDEPLALADLGLLVVVGGALHLEALRLFHQVVGVVAAEHGQPAEAQLPGDRGHPVEEGAVVADDDHGPLVLEEKVLQPGERVQVQVVGGLVKQQQRGLFEEQLGEQQPHDPAAREVPHRPVQVPGGETQAEQHPLDLRADAEHVATLEGVLQVPLQGEQRVDLRAVRVEQGQFLAHPVELFLLGEHVVKGGLGLVEQAAAVQVDGHLLRQIGHRKPRGAADDARVHVLLAAHDAEEGGLAGAVDAGQPHPVAGVDLDGDVAEDRLAAVLQVQVIDTQHGNTGLQVAGRSGSGHDRRQGCRQGLMIGIGRELAACRGCRLRGSPRRRAAGRRRPEPGGGNRPHWGECNPT